MSILGHSWRWSMRISKKGWPMPDCFSILGAKWEFTARSSPVMPSRLFFTWPHGVSCILGSQMPIQLSIDTLTYLRHFLCRSLYLVVCSRNFSRLSLLAPICVLSFAWLSGSSQGIVLTAAALERAKSGCPQADDFCFSWLMSPSPALYIVHCLKYC